MISLPASETNSNWSLVGYGLVFGSLVLSWLASIVLGGFKIGSLERRVEHRMAREEYAAFWERMQQRLLQIGFQPGTEPGVFAQSGAQFGDLSSYTHAKTKKEFRATASDDGTNIIVQMSLRYLDPIVGDSGESAFRDSVLDFVSGKSDGMRTVPNRSFAALSSLIGGIVACFGLAALKFVGFKPIVPPLLMLTGADVVIGIIAIVAIRSKPGELNGLWVAVAGIGLSLFALVAAVVM